MATRSRSVSAPRRYVKQLIMLPADVTADQIEKIWALGIRRGQAAKDRVLSQRDKFGGVMWTEVCVEARSVHMVARAVKAAGGQIRPKPFRLYREPDRGGGWRSLGW